MTTFRSEKDVKRAIKVLLDRYGWFWWMTPANGYGASGVSDFCALKDGVFLAIEAKFGKNKPTAMQVGFLNSISAEHSFGFVVNEHNLNWLEVFLSAFAEQARLASKDQKMSHEGGAALIDAIQHLQAPVI